MLPGKKYGVDDALRLLRNHWRLALAPLLLASIGTWAVTSRLPNVYRAETLIEVVPQRIPNRYVSATVTEGIEARLPTINQQIMSRSRLERIIADINPYPELRDTEVMEDLVQRLKLDIKVALEKGDSFRVGFESQDPVIAFKVTDRLASLYIEENLRDRERSAENINQFLDAQLEDAKTRLMEHERKLEEYRRRFSGQLPSQLETNLQGMQASQSQLQTIADSINRARERRFLYERELAEAQAPVVTPGPTPVASPNSGEPPVDLTAAQQLEATRKRLDAVKLRYTSDHPDVRALERLIADLEVKAADEAKASPGDKPVRSMTAGETERQRRVASLRAEIAVIDRQIVEKQDEDRKLRADIASYKGKIDAVPTRESELTELMRDYNSLQASYESLAAKREDSKIARDLERRQVGEQFKVIDAAKVPARPFRPDRLRLNVTGALVGLVLGLALVASIEVRDKSLKSADDVVRVLGVQVLAVVPIMVSDEDRRREARRRLRDYVLTGAFIVVISAGMLFIWRH